MTREELLEHLNSNNGTIIIPIIVKYCLEKGKPINLIAKFIKVLQLSNLYGIANVNTSLLGYYYDYALTYYITKYNIILLFDKNNKFIKAF